MPVRLTSNIHHANVRRGSNPSSKKKLKEAQRQTSYHRRLYRSVETSRLPRLTVQEQGEKTTQSPFQTSRTTRSQVRWRCLSHCWSHVAMQLGGAFSEQMLRSAAPQDITPPGNILYLRVFCWQIVSGAPSCSCPLSNTTCCFFSSSSVACKTFILLSTTFATCVIVSHLFLLVLACNICCIMTQFISLRLSSVIFTSTVHSGALIAASYSVGVSQSPQQDFRLPPPTAQVDDGLDRLVHTKTPPRFFHRAPQPPCRIFDCPDKSTQSPIRTCSHHRMVPVQVPHHIPLSAVAANPRWDTALTLQQLPPLSKFIAHTLSFPICSCGGGHPLRRSLSSSGALAHRRFALRRQAHQKTFGSSDDPLLTPLPQTL